MFVVGKLLGLINSPFVVILLVLSISLGAVANTKVESQNSQITSILGRGIISDISPNGSMIAISSNLGVWIYDNRLVEIKKISSYSTRFVKWDPSGGKLALVTNDHLEIVDGLTWDILFTVKSNEVEVGWKDPVIAWKNNEIVSLLLNHSTIYSWDVVTQEASQYKSNKALVSFLWRPNGNDLVAVSNDEIMLWNKDAKNWDSFPLGFVDSCVQLTWNPDSTLLAIWTCFTFRDVYIWKIQDLSFTQVPSQDHSSVIWQNNEQIILGTSDGKIEMWNVETAQRLATWGDFEHIEQLEWITSNHEELLIHTSNQVINITDVVAKKTIMTFYEYTLPVDVVAWQPGGDLIASCEHGDGLSQIRIWSIKTQETVALLELPLADSKPRVSLEWSNDGELLMFNRPGLVDADSHNIYIWKFSDHIPQLIFTGNHEDQGNFNFIATLASLHPDGSLVASLVQDNSRKSSIWIWDINSGKIIAQIGSGQNEYAILWHPSKHILAIISLDNTVDFWDVDTQKYLNQLTVADGSTYGIYDNVLAWSPDEKKIISGGCLGVPYCSLWIWEAVSGSTLTLIPEAHPNGYTMWEGLSDVKWKPDGSQFASVGGSDHSLRIWNAEDGGLEMLLSFNEDFPTSLSWSSDGKYLTVGGHSGATYIVNN